MAVDAKTLPSWGSTDTPPYDGRGHVPANVLPTGILETFVWTDGGGGGEVVREIPLMPRREP